LSGNRKLGLKLSYSAIPATDSLSFLEFLKQTHA